MKGYNISFTVKPEQLKAPSVTIMSRKETDLIDQEIREMLRKGAILVAKNLEGQILSSLFLIGKKERGESSSNQSERIEQSGLLCTLREGGSVSVERNASARGLYVKD